MGDSLFVEDIDFRIMAQGMLGKQTLDAAFGQLRDILRFVLAQRALEEFQPPRVLAVFPSQGHQKATANKTKVNDEIIYLFHDQRPHLLKRLGGEIQVSDRLVLESLPELEDIPLASIPESLSEPI